MSGADHDDRDLEALLSETAELGRRYREAGCEEPSPALDDAIRAAARRSVGARPSSVAPRVGGSWRVPLSIAAVVVVSATLTLMVSEHREQRPPVVPGGAHEPASAMRLDSSAGVSASSKQAAPAAPSSESVPAPLGGTLQREAVPEAKEAAVEAREDRDSQARRETAARAAQETPAPAPSAAGRAASSNAEPAQKMQMESDGRPLRAPAPPGPAIEPKRESGARDEAPLGANAMRAAQQAKPLTEEQPPVASKDEPSKTQMQTRSPRAFSSAPAKSAADEGAAAPSAQAAAPWESSPQAWLKHVDELRAAGRLPEARASFEEFRRRYPDYPLPAGFVAP